MNSLIILVVCLIIAVGVQYAVSSSDSILMGLAVPTIFTVLGIVISVTTSGNSLNKFSAFMEFFIPALVALFVYYKAKRRKLEKKRKEKEAMKAYEDRQSQVAKGLENANSTSKEKDNDNMEEVIPEVMDKDEIRR